MNAMFASGGSMCRRSRGASGAAYIRPQQVRLTSLNDPPPNRCRPIYRGGKVRISRQALSNQPIGLIGCERIHLSTRRLGQQEWKNEKRRRRLSTDETRRKWLGGRDSNPDNVVQRAVDGVWSAPVRAVSGRFSRSHFRRLRSVSPCSCAACLIVSQPTRPSAALRAA